MFFWIIVLSFLIPMAMRYYKKSVRGRNQNQGMPGGPDQFGQFPGDSPGHYPGPQNKQPRDGFTQRDYYGAFGQLGAPQQPAPPANQPYPTSSTPTQYPGQQGHPYPVPYEDSPGYPGNQPRPFQQPRSRTPQQPSSPQAAARRAPRCPAPPPSAPQGFRARKLAELDQRYSEGELHHGGLHGPARGDHEGLTPATQATRGHFAPRSGAGWALSDPALLCLGGRAGALLSRPGGSRGRSPRWTGPASGW